MVSCLPFQYAPFYGEEGLNLLPRAYFPMSLYLLTH